jgi:hypothetical protein
MYANGIPHDDDPPSAPAGTETEVDVFREKEVASIPLDLPDYFFAAEDRRTRHPHAVDQRLLALPWVLGGAGTPEPPGY